VKIIMPMMYTEESVRPEITWQGRKYRVIMAKQQAGLWRRQPWENLLQDVETQELKWVKSGDENFLHRPPQEITEGSDDPRLRSEPRG
jgi:hypothetical protein